MLSAIIFHRAVQLRHKMIHNNYRQMKIQAVYCDTLKINYCKYKAKYPKHTGCTARQWSQQAHLH